MGGAVISQLEDFDVAAVRKITRKKSNRQPNRDAAVIFLILLPCCCVGNDVAGCRRMVRL